MSSFYPPKRNPVLNRLKTTKMDDKDISRIDDARKKFDVISEKARIAVYRKVLEHFQKHPASPWSGAPLADLERTIRSFYESLGLEYKEAFRETLPPLMQRFYDQAAQELRKAGLRNAILGKPDAGRVKYFLDSAFDQVAMKTENMTFQHVKALRSLSADVFRQMSVTGATRREVSKALLDRAMEIPGFQFIDKAGNRWPLKSYFDTLARTELMTAARASYDDKVTEEGFDVMKLSTSGNCCEKCARFEGRLFSLTGSTPGLPTKQDLIEAGVFHPNCTHSYSLVPDYIRERDYNPDGTRKQQEKIYARNIGNNSRKIYSATSAQDKEQHKLVEDAVRAINNGETALPESEVVRMKEDQTRPETRAAYNPNTKKIEIYDVCPPDERGFAELHERAHQWDIFFDITNSERFKPVLHAIQETETYANVFQYHAFGMYPEDQYQYFVDPKELWARACSQYIAKKANSKKLLFSLEKLKKSDINDLCAGQWEDDDFAGVYSEIEKLLRELGVVK